MLSANGNMALMWLRRFEATRSTWSSLLNCAGGANDEGDSGSAADISDKLGRSENVIAVTLDAVEQTGRFERARLALMR